MKNQQKIFFFLYSTQLKEGIQKRFSEFSCTIIYPAEFIKSRSLSQDKPFSVIIETAPDRWEWISALLACYPQDFIEHVFLLSPSGFKDTPPPYIPLEKPVYLSTHLKDIYKVMGATNRKKVLFVDDDDLALRAYKRFFNRANWEFISASSGDMALKILENKTPNLVVTDIKMPGMHGVELISKIRMINRELPIFACSAYPGMKDDPELQYNQIEAFIEKPVNIAQLKVKIDEFLN